MRTTCLILILILFGCAGHRIHERSASFEELDYAPYEKKGSASVSGQAFLKTRGGEIKFGAGNRVFLNPVTAYSTEWFEKEVVGGERLSDPDPRTKDFERTTIADAEGRFRFEGLPPGDYYVTCRISWEVVDSWGGFTQTGGTAHARVKLGPNDHLPVVLTR